MNIPSHVLLHVLHVLHVLPPHLTPTVTLIFIAASSAARYLNTYGIATRSMPLLALSHMRQMTVGVLLLLCTPAIRPWLKLLTAGGLATGDRMLPQWVHTSHTW
jgi:hypothetical protein